MASRTLVEANAVFTGMMLEASLARLRASMAKFSEERAPPCSVGCWDSVAMVETQDSHEEAVRGVHAVRKNQNLLNTSIHPVIGCLVRIDPFGEENWLFGSILT